MFGTYRLFLAVLVLLSHMKVTVLGVNPGICAVVQFFLVSGYVMTALIERHYQGPGRRTLWFYADRAIRIVPQYLFFLLLTIGWAWYEPSYLRAPYTAGVLAAHFLIVPLNLYPFWPALHQAFLLPQAASLALEEQFYLLFPAVLRRRAVLLACFAVSFVLFALATSGRIERITHTYVLLTGTMFIFLTGALLRWNVERRFPTVGVALCWGAVAALAALLAWKHKVHLGYNREILSGLLVGVPAIALLGRLRQRPWDDVVGRASYGVFLCHMLVAAVLVKLLGGSVGEWWFRPLAVVASIAVGGIGWWVVERPTARLRYELRRRRAPEISAA